MRCTALLSSRDPVQRTLCMCLKWGGLQLGEKRTGTIQGHGDRAKSPGGRSLISSRCGSQEEGAGGSRGPCCSAGGRSAHSLPMQSCPGEDATLQNGGPSKLTLTYFQFWMVPHRHVPSLGAIVSFHKTGLTYILDARSASRGTEGVPPLKGHHRDLR